MSFRKYNIDKEYKLLSLMKVNYTQENRIRISNALLNKVDFLKVDNDITATKVKFSSFDKNEIDLYIYKPAEIEGNLPCMVYIHGGGFFLKGDILTPKILTEYIRKFKMVIIYVDYRLSLDYSYPVPLMDCYSALKWSRDNSDYLGINPDKIFLTGFSAGGALTAGVSLLARDEGLDCIRAQILISPVTDHRQITESVNKFTDTPNWNKKSNSYMWELYLRDIDGDIPYYASPAIAPSFKKLPPTYVEVAQYDPLHDEGVNYYSEIKNKGIISELNDTIGTIHMSSIQLNSKKTIKNMDRMINFIKRIIDG